MNKSFLLRRRWGLLFLNVTAGLALAPFIYWDGIFMRVMLSAAPDGATLLGLTVLAGLGNLLLLLFAAVVMGGCMHALRGVMADSTAFLPAEFMRGLRRTAKTSLVAGALIALSLLVMRAGLVNLYTQPPLPAPWRPILTIMLALQLLIILPWALLMFCQPEGLQCRPLHAFSAAANQLFRQPLLFGLLLLPAMLPVLFFSFQRPWAKFIGLFCVMFFLLVPVMMRWQKSVQAHTLTPQTPRNYWHFLVLAVFGVASTIALIVPGLGHGSVVRTTLGETWAFLLRQVTLEADNTTVRSLLSSSSVWPWMAAALLGTACLILVTYTCACYRFRGRGLIFFTAVALQLWPMLSRYSALEQLLRSMDLPVQPVVIIAAWAGFYLLASLMLYRKFARMRPKLQQRRCQEKYPGARLFFYYAFPRARLAVIALVLLTTLGGWPDILAPFWHMQELGAFSLVEFIARAI
ncbi:MAG: hypothetical protein FWD06_07310 [Oscillospiraceae bacterium]|nr:hypothetical protein [Oscillospiraceae bacterium]